jgi:benzoylformate decarboxylase
MRDLLSGFLNGSLSRRTALRKLMGFGLTAAAAQAVLDPLEASEKAAKNEPVPGAAWVQGSGGELVVAQMRAAGVEYLFTNPGSFEVGLFDAFIDQPDMHLIMGLHEGIVIAMADGFARVSGKPGFVNVHVIAGTAQMAGQLYNSSRDGVALVVTAGLNDNEAWSDEAGLAPRPGFDQKEVTRQFTKISWEARQAASLPLMLRRAFKTAATAPGGPVYLAMAHYALESKGVKAQILPANRFLVPAKVRPQASAVEQAARLLIEAKRPVLVAGDEIWKSGAQAALVAFAERFGLPVMDFSSGYKNFPVHHDHYLGGFGLGHEYVKGGVELLVAVGARDFGGRVVPAGPEAPMDARFLRIGLDTASMSRNYPTDLALVGDVKESLDDLTAALNAMLTKDRAARIAQERKSVFVPMAQASRRAAEAAARKNFGQSPIHPDELGAVMARVLDRDTILVSENLTGRHVAFPFGYRENELMWVGNTGNGLGWGIGASVGAKLAAPDRPVVCSIGDGSVMYSAAGFWTQARYHVPVLTVVWNNHNYQTVRHAYAGYKGRMAQSGHYAGMYLGDPDIDFAQLAASQGVRGEKVARGADLEAALKRGIAATRDGNPYLVDVVIGRYGGGAESTWHGSLDLAQKRRREV